MTDSSASAVVAIVTLILFLIFGSNVQYYTVPAMVISKIYCNTVMVILLNRPSKTKPRLHDLDLLQNLASSHRGRGIEINTEIQVNIHEEALCDTSGATRLSLPSTIVEVVSSVVIRDPSTCRSCSSLAYPRLQGGPWKACGIDLRTTGQPVILGTTSKF